MMGRFQMLPRSNQWPEQPKIEIGEESEIQKKKIKRLKKFWQPHTLQHKTNSEQQHLKVLKYKASKTI